jgi:hypothetical protein
LELGVRTSYKVKNLVKLKTYYIGRDDWLHDVVLPAGSKITGRSKLPQQLFEITACADPEAVSFFDWVAVFNGEKGYGFLSNMGLEQLFRCLSTWV